MMPHVDEGTLHAYLDGELPSAERKTVEAHLSDCASCRASLAEERAVRERANALLDATRPAETAAPPFEQLRSPRVSKRPWYVRTPVAWAASIAVAVGIGYYLHQPDQRGVLPNDQPAVAYQEADKATQKTATKAPPPASVARRESGRAVPRPVPEASAPSARADVAATGSAAEPPSETRTPAPAPSNAARQVPPSGAVASTLARRELDMLRDNATTINWPIISRGDARSLLGTDPVGLPGLTARIRRSPAGDGTIVVEQPIDSGTTVQLFQRSGTGAVDAAPKDRLARYVGTLRVEIAGPLSVDSLNRLLDQLKALP